MSVRDFAVGDEGALYDVCVRTGADGGDATDQYVDHALLPAVYVGPYLAFEPGFAFVLDDGSGAEGYVLAALDSRAFEERCEQQWWPVLRERYPIGSFAEDSADAHLVRLIHQPHRAPDDLVVAFPSHLHIDLLPRWQGGGWGRRLMESLLERLAERGSAGVHLGVSSRNERALGFYRRLGFTALEEMPGAVVLGRSLR